MDNTRFKFASSVTCKLVKTVFLCGDSQLYTRTRLLHQPCNIHCHNNSLLLPVDHDNLHVRQLLSFLPARRRQTPPTRRPHVPRVWGMTIVRVSVVRGEISRVPWRIGWVVTRGGWVSFPFPRGKSIKGIVTWATVGVSGWGNEPVRLWI